MRIARASYHDESLLHSEFNTFAKTSTLRLSNVPDSGYYQLHHHHRHHRRRSSPRLACILPILLPASHRIPASRPCKDRTQGIGVAKTEIVFFTIILLFIAVS